MIGGRRYFDLADGWGGNHPMGVPTFIVIAQRARRLAASGLQHPFVTDGLDSAVEQAKAAAGDDKFVGVATPNIIQQLLNNGRSTPSTSTSCRCCSAPACRSSPTSPTPRCGSPTRRSSRAPASPTSPSTSSATAAHDEAQARDWPACATRRTDGRRQQLSVQRVDRRRPLARSTTLGVHYEKGSHRTAAASAQLVGAPIGALPGPSKPTPPTARCLRNR